MELLLGAWASRAACADLEPEKADANLLTAAGQGKRGVAEALPGARGQGVPEQHVELARSSWRSMRSHPFQSAASSRSLIYAGSRGSGSNS